MAFSASIPSNQASPLLTSAIEARYDEMKDIKVNNFFRSFYKEVFSNVMYPVIEIRRGSERIAKDVPRGHQGRRIEVSKFTQKAFQLLYFNQYFDATTLQQYFRVFGSSSFAQNDLIDLGGALATERKASTDMIERTMEIHCASILEDGSITASDGSILDFGRKADSMIDKGAGQYWDDHARDIYADMKEMCDFLRQVGKAQGQVFNFIAGTKVFQAMRRNDEFNKRLSQINNKRDLIPPSQMNATGAIYQFETDVDSYKVRVWTYNDFYQTNEDNVNPTFAPYKVEETGVMLPEAPKFTMLYGAVPRVTTDLNTATLLSGKFIFSDFVNPEKKYHRFYTESAPLPVPEAIDQICTIQALPAA